MSSANCCSSGPAHPAMTRLRVREGRTRGCEARGASECAAAYVFALLDDPPAVALADLCHLLTVTTGTWTFHSEAAYSAKFGDRGRTYQRLSLRTKKCVQSSARTNVRIDRLRRGTTIYQSRETVVLFPSRTAQTGRQQAARGARAGAQWPRRAAHSRARSLTPTAKHSPKSPSPCAPTLVSPPAFQQHCIASRL